MTSEGPHPPDTLILLEEHELARAAQATATEPRGDKGRVETLALLYSETRSAY